MQTNHSHYQPNKHDKTFIVVCDGIESPANLGSLFRLCDAFGVTGIVTTVPVPINSGRFRKTARNTFEQIPSTVTEDVKKTLSHLHSEGFQLLGLEITENSIPIQQYPTRSNKKFALVVGNESEGIAPDLLAMLPTVLHIPMFGANSSMNVVQATAIALYQLVNDE